ncbi:MAG: RNA polymerase sigma factor [Candidatus Hinthialibacter antarcticus]|nr:RNA polymerase sigma factor [Candidatus Hinthialibacter antarcticus]
MKSAPVDYNAVIEPIKDRMKRSIIRIVQNPDDAADAFQDALFRVWMYWERIVCHPNPQGYILSICVSSSYDLLRKKSKAHRLEQSLYADSAQALESVPPPVMKQELTQLIRQAILDLPLKQAQAVFLRLFEEESYTEISKAMDCKEETVRSHVSKGLSKLREVLNDQNISLAEVSS